MDWENKHLREQLKLQLHDNELKDKVQTRLHENAARSFLKKGKVNPKLNDPKLTLNELRSFEKFSIKTILKDLSTYLISFDNVLN